MSNVDFARRAGAFANALLEYQRIEIAFSMHHAMLFYRLKEPLLAGALLLSASLTPSPAQACSYPGPVSFQFGSTVAGDIDVPTNAALFVRGSTSLSASDVELVDAAGALVPFDARRVGPTELELIPRDELLPEHEYMLQSTRSTDSFDSTRTSIAFATGKGPVDVPAQLEAPILDVWLLEYQLGTCGEQTGICVEAAHPPATTLEVRIGDELLGPGVDESWPRRRDRSEGVAPEACIEVRVRDVRGNRSEPSVACGEQLRRARLQSDVYGVTYTCDNYESYLDPRFNGGSSEAASVDAGSALVEPALSLADGVLGETTPAATEVGRGAATGGCSLGPTGAARSSLAGLVLSVAALLVAGRRRRARAPTLDEPWRRG